MNQNKKVVALESRLRHCQNVITLGVRPNFSDYSEDEAELILNSTKVYYPSTYYVDMFDAMGKSTFPSAHTYRFVQDKIKQSALFKMLNLPHPRTRFFYGKKKLEKILSYFNYPFVAKVPRGSALGRGVYLIQNDHELNDYCTSVTVAYIQEYLPIDRDIRAVVIGDRVVHSYWRIAAPGEFRNNLNQGGRIDFDNIPEKSLDLAIEIARKCGWNDVGIDICEYQNEYFVLEANMKYGKEGFRKAGIDYIKMMEKMIDNGEI